MPTSGYWQISKLVEIIVALNPASVLDIGVGFGKYGFLAREYLELWDGQSCYSRDTWQHRIDGIEVYASYLTPVHAYVYDHLYNGKAQDILPNLDVSYELVLLIDVFEHLDRKEGAQLLEVLLSQARSVLVCLPSRFIAQNAAFGNPYEAHRAHWSRQDLRVMGDCTFISNRRSTICLYGVEARARWRRHQRSQASSRLCYVLKRLCSPLRVVRSGATTLGNERNR